MSEWGFITNHGTVLTLVSRQPRLTARQIASHLGITERSVQRIISDLATKGYLRRTREGRSNHYEVDETLSLPESILTDVAVGDLLNVLRSSIKMPGEVRPESPVG